MRLSIHRGKGRSASSTPVSVPEVIPDAIVAAIPEPDTDPYLGAFVRIIDLSRDHGLTGYVVTTDYRGPIPTLLVRLASGREIYYRADQVRVEEQVVIEE